jgi:Leucine-rich repeat (LRR) protein
VQLPREQVIGQYRILWVQNESPAELTDLLLNGSYDGFGFNPHNGWTGNFSDIVNLEAPVKALAIPFGDLIGFDGKFLQRHPEIELVWISDFSGELVVEGDARTVVRLTMTPRIRLGSLPNLSWLYMYGASSEDIESLSAAGLKHLELHVSTLLDLDGLQKFENLEKLEVAYLRKLQSITALKKLRKLNWLMIEQSKKIEDIEGTLEQLTALETLRLIKCSTLKSLSFLEHLQLEEFRCVGTTVRDKSTPALQRIPVVYIG